MPLDDVFNAVRLVEDHDIRVAIDASLKITTTFHEKPVLLQKAAGRLLAGLLENHETGVAAADYAAMMGRNLDTQGDYSAILSTMKAQVHNIRKALHDACPDEPIPDITPLLPAPDRMAKDYREDCQQAYILTPAIPGKPAYEDLAGKLHMGKRRWAAYVDVACLSDKPDDLRVYKRRIADWHEGIVMAGNTYIPLSPLKTMAVAHTLENSGTPFGLEGASISTLFGNAVLAGSSIFNSSHYNQILTKAAKEITAATNRPGIEERLLSCGNSQSAAECGLRR